MNSTNQIKEFLNQIHPISDQSLTDYINEWEYISYPKNNIITAPGEVEKYWYFVLDGIQKSYYLNKEKEHIIAFTYPPSFSGIPESVLTQTPSKYYLECITDSQFLRIPYKKHLELMDKHREIEKLFRIATEQFLVGMLKRYYELMAYDIETRFKSFIRRSPHLLNMISQKDLASYLRIDPTNFSKLINSVRL